MATLEQIRDAIRARLGWPSTDAFVTDTELDGYILESLRELYRFLVSIHGPDHFVEIEEFATIAGEWEYRLDGVDRILRIDCDIGGGHRVPFVKGNLVSHVFARTGVGWTWQGQVDYFHSNNPGGAILRFDPPPLAVHTVRVFHVEGESEISDLEPADENQLGHDDYVILDCMIKCRTKEESDSSDLVALKSAYEARARANAAPMDIGQPQTITDMRGSMDVDREIAWWRR